MLIALDSVRMPICKRLQLIRSTHLPMPHLTILAPCFMLGLSVALMIAYTLGALMSSLKVSLFQLSQKAIIRQYVSTALVLAHLMANIPSEAAR